MPGVPWRVEFSKIFKIFFFKIPKTHKIDPKRIQTCFDCNLGQFFRKIFAQFSMEVRVFENYQKNQKISKFLKCPKAFPKVSKRVLNVFWGKLLEKILPSFSWKVESSKIFLIIKKFSKFKNAQNRSQNLQTCFEHVLGQTFRKIFARFSMECRIFENFQKKYFQNSKNAQKCSQKYPNLF